MIITELELSLHAGEITLLDYLEQKKKGLDLPPRTEWEKPTENKAKGTTRKMKEYCRTHGLDGIPDLDIVWKKPRTCRIWRVGL